MRWMPLNSIVDVTNVICSGTPALTMVTTVTSRTMGHPLEKPALPGAAGLVGSTFSSLATREKSMDIPEEIHPQRQPSGTPTTIVSFIMEGALGRHYNGKGQAIEAGT